MSGVILDLCGGTGSWSAPYREAGYDVRLVDPLQGGTDVRLFRYPGRVRGILAAPPCTVFAVSGNRWPRTDADYREALSVVDACLRLVVACRPAWWALENPVGKLRWWIGPPKMTFNPCDFVDDYTKRTCLWGEFTPPQIARLDDPTLHPHPAPYRGDAVPNHRLGPCPERAMIRSVTPPSFARAFFKANP